MGSKIYLFIGFFWVLSKGANSTIIHQDCESCVQLEKVWCYSPTLSSCYDDYIPDMWCDELALTLQDCSNITSDLKPNNAENNNLIIKPTFETSTKSVSLTNSQDKYFLLEIELENLRKENKLKDIKIQELKTKLKFEENQHNIQLCQAQNKILRQEILNCSLNLTKCYQEKLKVESDFKENLKVVAWDKNKVQNLEIELNNCCVNLDNCCADLSDTINRVQISYTKLNEMKFKAEEFEMKGKNSSVRAEVCEVKSTQMNKGYENLYEHFKECNESLVTSMTLQNTTLIRSANLKLQLTLKNDTLNMMDLKVNSLNESLQILSVNLTICDNEYLKSLARNEQLHADFLLCNSTVHKSENKSNKYYDLEVIIIIFGLCFLIIMAFLLILKGFLPCIYDGKNYSIDLNQIRTAELKACSSQNIYPLTTYV